MHVNVCPSCATAITNGDFTEHHYGCDCIGDGSDCADLANQLTMLAMVDYVDTEPMHVTDGYWSCFTCSDVVIDSGHYAELSA